MLPHNVLCTCEYSRPPTFHSGGSRATSSFKSCNQFEPIPIYVTSPRVPVKLATVSPHEVGLVVGELHVLHISVLAPGRGVSLPLRVGGCEAVELGAVVVPPTVEDQPPLPRPLVVDDAARSVLGKHSGHRTNTTNVTNE